LLLFLLALAALGGAVVIYAFAIEPAWLKVRRRVLFVESGGPELDGLTILHLSDFHIGRSNRRLMRFLKTASRINADVFVITGDFVHRPDAIADIPEVLSALGNHPMVLGVAGNHDRYGYSTPWPGATGRPFDSSLVIQALQGAGVTMLIDSVQSIETKNGTVTFWGAGLSPSLQDRSRLVLGGNVDLKSVVLLAHSPDVLYEAAHHGIPLVLCGHTHGGQIRIGPWFTPTTATRVPLKRPSGVITRGRTIMHISPGLGTTLLPARFFARPEVTLLELRTPPTP
jgi:uncharacterized protein